MRSSEPGDTETAEPVSLIMSSSAGLADSV
jgi:hypothetical protein